MNQLSNEFFTLDYLADRVETTRHAFTGGKFRSSRAESMENAIHFINFSSCPRAKRRMTRTCRSNKFSDWSGRGEKKGRGRSNGTNRFIYFFSSPPLRSKTLSESPRVYFLTARFIFMTCLSRPTANKLHVIG